MFIRIIKKSLKDKPIMNLVVFLFIILASSFLASSINSLSVVTNSITRYLDLSNVPELVFLTSDKTSEISDDILTWINQSKEVSNYGAEESIMINEENIKVNGEEFKISNTYVLQKQPKEYIQVYNQNDELTEVKKGEIALPMIEKSQRNIQLGDTITLQFGSLKKDLIVSSFIKDSLCGSNLMGIKRLILHEDDYYELSQEDNLIYLMFHCIETDQLDLLIKYLYFQNFNAIIIIDHDLIHMTYLIEKLISGILILYSISLILIAFCILRFTILFCIQEEYKEIGIMKGLGIRNWGIQQLYIMKYVAMGSVGSAFGFFLSIWFQSIVINLLGKNIIIQQTKRNLILNLICCIMVVFIIILYSFLVTRKINRLSVMDAIRDGNRGERFHNTHHFTLNKHMKCSSILFLAIRDILSQWKQYISLTITFALGIIFIILPLNAVNTLDDSNTIMPLLGVQYCDVFISQKDQTRYLQYKDPELIIKEIEELEQYYIDHDINIKLHIEIGYSFTLQNNMTEDRFTVLALQGIRSDSKDYHLSEGVAPILPNEIALSDMLAKKLGVQIGDTIGGYNEKLQFDFLITGIYQNMNNMGESMRLAPSLMLKGHSISAVLDIQGTFQNPDNKDEQFLRLEKLSTDMTIYNIEEYQENTLGDISKQINQVRDVIVLIVLGVNGLITLLMMRLFSSKEQTEIAMLKSLGFRNHSIKLWQVYRIMLVLLLALILGVVISYPMSHVIISVIFTMLGVSNIKIIIHPLEVFIIYPLIIFVITSIIAFFSIGNVKKIDFTSMKHME